VVACPGSTVVETDVLCSSCSCTAIVAVRFVDYLAGCLVDRLVARLVDRLVDRLALVAVDAVAAAAVTAAVVYEAVV
jgi:selenocysteine lyase/cysteine desulfurase